MKTLRIFHTNDIHSHFTEFAGIAGFLRQQADPARDLILDGGDFCDMVSPMISGTDGTGGIRLLEAAGYDAMAIGNNEFFAGVSPLEKMAAMKLPLLSCNLQKLDGSALAGVRSHLILTKGGRRILVIGVSPYWDPAPGSTAFLAMAGLRCQEPYACIQNILDQQKGHYEIAILLSHAGDTHDQMIIARTHGLSAVISAHLHWAYDLQEQDGVYQQESGCNGQYLGCLNLTLDEAGRVSAACGQNIVNQFPADPAVEQLRQKETARGIAVLSKPLYCLRRELSFDPFHECLLGNAIADALWQEYHGDLGLIHNGIVETGLAGEISRLKLLAVSPSYLNPTAVTYTGKQIREAAAQAFLPEVTHRAGHGPGFRGHVLGALSFSRNVTVTRQPFSLTLNGREMADDQTYRVITDDYLQRGSGYAMLKAVRTDTVFYSGFIRDLMQRAFASESFVASIEIGRIHGAHPSLKERRTMHE